MSRPLILFHGGCRDGFGAAWAAWNKFGASAEYLPVNYGQPLPEQAVGRDLFVCDFSYSRPQMIELAIRCRSLTVLDHHKTAQEALTGLEQQLMLEFGLDSRIIFDMDRSGAGITWDYFFPNVARPWPIDYVEDRDLWRFALPKSKQVGAYLGIVPFDFDAWNKLGASTIDEATEKGQLILDKVDQYCAEVARNVRIVDMFGYERVPIINAPHVDISELLNYLVNEYPTPGIAVGWTQRADGLFQFSLRSKGDIDVSTIAKRYGGGGHHNAAGYQTTDLPLQIYATR